MSRLYVFDMDGTLIPDTTAMLEIAKLTGHLEEVVALETAYLQQTMDSETFGKVICEIWRHMTHEHIKEAYRLSPKMKNIKSVIQKIADEGALSCMITSSQDFFAHHFYEYGFDFIFASKEYCLKTRKLIPNRSLEAIHKLRITQKLCEKLDIPFIDTVAFGDSLSDVDLFQNLVHTISINGNHHIRELAAHHYKGDDLMEAFLQITQAIKSHQHMHAQ